MNEPPGARARVALTGLAIAGKLRVLLIDCLIIHELKRIWWQLLTTSCEMTCIVYDIESHLHNSHVKICYGLWLEYFRDQEGQDVLLFVDNIFRFTQAGSEVSALLGRIPSAVGYQPTLATDMGLLQERITSTGFGSITSVQVETSLFTIYMQLLIFMTQVDESSHAAL